jgi:DMSO/TMAO reductase YedYZ molybdopterin-dependent catalytic subunit
MFAMDQNKTQEERVLAAEDAEAGVIVSPDTKRVNRVPPGQSRTRKWPILDTSGAPPISLDRWKFSIGGLVANPKEWDWREFQQLERVKVFADFHCVTHWSRLGNTWEGVSTRKLVELAGSALPAAAHVLARGYDTGFSTNVPLADFLAEDALVALLHDGQPPHDGQPLTEGHGWPARLIVPQLYAWKSAKWIAGFELLERDKAGFWERNGYHMHGDPWKEERFGW